MHLPDYKFVLDTIILVSTAGGAVWGIKKALVNPILQRCKNCKKWFERLDKGLKSIEKIESQFYNNGGSSLRDAVDDMNSRLTYMENKENALLDDYEQGIFICDQNGVNSFVSRTYAHMLGSTRDELMNHGWKNFICDSSAEEHNELWTSAFKSLREVKTIVCMKKVDSSQICVTLQIIPLNKETDKIKRFMGRVKRNACLGSKCPNRGKGCCAATDSPEMLKNCDTQRIILES